MLVKHAFPVQCVFESLGGQIDQAGIVIGGFDGGHCGDPKSGMITVHVNKRHRVIKVYDHGGAGANVSPQQLGEPPIVPHLVHIRHFSVVEAGTDAAGFAARWCDSLSDHGGVR
jgi:hypothetical protein